MWEEVEKNQHESQIICKYWSFFCQKYLREKSSLERKRKKTKKADYINFYCHCEFHDVHHHSIVLYVVQFVKRSIHSTASDINYSFDHIRNEVVTD